MKLTNEVLKVLEEKKIIKQQLDINFDSEKALKNLQKAMQDA